LVNTVACEVPAGVARDEAGTAIKLAASSSPVVTAMMWRRVMVPPWSGSDIT